MNIAVIAITKNGTECARKICTSIKADLYIKDKFTSQELLNSLGERYFIIKDDFSKVVEKLFKSYEGIIFIMAVGIVVRSISPLLKDKQTDPAIVVVDEMGHFAISLLSGHIGGANRLAIKVSDTIGATPVITTATDINGVTAFDELAVKNDCIIENIKDLKYISSELVNGGKIGFFTDLETIGSLRGDIVLENKACNYSVVISNKQKLDIIAEKILYLRPKNLVLGIGCRKGKSFSEIKEAIYDFLNFNNKSIFSVRSIASVSLKKEELGIVEFSSSLNIPFVTFEPEQLKKVEQYFEVSEFVKNVTGVGNVCESSAFMESRNGRIICKKTLYNGITLALAEDEKIIYL